MTLAARLLGAALASAAMAGIAWTSNAPMTAHGSGDAVLRLAWSALPERVETCREQSAEDLARLPPHMRQRLVCEGQAASYRLTVRAHGTLIADDVVRAGGLRHDRRLYVLREIRVPPARTDVEVRFDRIDAGPTGAGPGRAAGPRIGERPPHQQGDTVPAHLAYAERVRFAPRRVVLITYDPQRRALVAVGASDAEGR